MKSLHELLQAAGYQVERITDHRDLQRYDAESLSALCQGWLADQPAVRCGTKCAHADDVHDCPRCEPRIAFDCAPIAEALRCDICQSELSPEDYHNDVCRKCYHTCCSCGRYSETWVTAGTCKPCQDGVSNG